jgi:hypothetical protein
MVYLEMDRHGVISPLLLQIFTCDEGIVQRALREEKIDFVYEKK